MNQRGKIKQRAAARKKYYKLPRAGLLEKRKCSGLLEDRIAALGASKVLNVRHGGATKELPLSPWRQFAEQLTSPDLSNLILKQREGSFIALYHKTEAGNSRIDFISSHVRSRRTPSAETHTKIESMEFGGTTYPLRAPVEGIYSRVHGKGGEYRIHEFGPYFTGRGESLKQAYRDWLEQVHVTFQDLYRKRPFEMTEQERSQWKVLEQAIDVAAYESRTPLVLREIGHLVTARPEPYKIVWMDNHSDVVALADMPAEFARFKAGQWFEAIVERDRPTGRLVRVQHVQAINALEPMSGSELAEFWKELPTTATLPSSNRDWATR